MWQQPAWLGLRGRLLQMSVLLLTVTSSLVAGAPSPSEAVAAHAAQVALAALEDVDALEAEARGAEGREAAARGPLEAYPALHVQLGQLLEASLVALRHLAAAHAAAPAAVTLSTSQLAEVAALDDQISGLLTVQTKEPLFFWHGPKWMVLSKLRRLFGGAAGEAAPSLQSRLQSLAGARDSSAFGEAAAEGLLGSRATEERGREDSAGVTAPSGQVPHIGVVLGDAECADQAGAGDRKPCKFEEVLDAAGAHTPSHLLVEPCSTAALQRIGTVLHGAEKPPYLSVLLDAAAFEHPERFQKAMNAALKSLGRKSIDLLWLPYEAFKKPMWPHYRELLNHLLDSGTISGYGVHADVRTRSVVTKLMDRKPAPLAWLTTHDVLRPVDSEAMTAVHSLDIAVVGLPRVAGLPSTAAAAHLQVLAGPEIAAQEAVQHTLSLQRGLALVLRPGLQDPKAMANMAKGLHANRRLGAVEVRWLNALRAASQPEKPFSLDTVAAADGPPQGLEEALRQGRRQAAQARADASTSGAKDVAGGPSVSDSADPVVPAVRPATLQELAQQRETYRKNDHVIYKTDFFDNATWDAIVGETKRLWKSPDLEANCNLDGVNRLGGYVLDLVSRNSSLYRLIYGNEQFRRWVSEVNGEGDMWPSDFPIELREYGRESQGMGCHPDLQMYAVPRKDLEFAVTVDNDSRCNVTFWDAAGTLHEVHTRANSVMMVRVNAAKHCVSPTAGGTRTILKFIFVGDYRKSSDFWMYTGNECGENNPNRRALVERRQTHAGEERSGTLEL